VKHLVSTDKFNVIGLEARDRVGGRVFTNEKGHEIGAAWIHGTHIHHPDETVEENPVLTMVKEFASSNELFLNSNFLMVNSDGSEIPSDVGIWDDLWIILNQIKKSNLAVDNAYQPTDISIYDFISMNWERLFTHVAPETVKAVIKFLIEWQGYYAGNWENISVGSMAVDKEFDGDQLLITNGGYTRLLNHYLHNYGLKRIIRLNTPVTEIHCNGDDGCKVFTVDSEGNCEEFEADVVVVTVPLGVLKENGIIFIPPLPQEKLDAINRLGFGIYDKIFIDFASPIETDNGGFWKSDMDVIYIVPKSDDDYREYCRTIAHGQPVEGDDGASRRPYDQRDPDHIGIEMANLSAINHRPKLVMLIYGKAALEMEEICHDPQLLTNFARSKLQNAFPNAFIPEIVGVEATSWGNDPYAHGSYANIPLGASGQDMHVLSLPVDNKILFAGEATFSMHYSTVHGALKSGRREFARLVSMFYPHEENEFKHLLL
jgi:polyamine oxidase